MISVDEYLGRKYNRNTYNCAHFVAELWQAVTGQDVATHLSGFLRPVLDRSAKPGLQRDYQRHAAPVSPCIVLMRRKGATPHVGMYWRGRVAHITELGAQYVPLHTATRGFTQVRYYTCR